MTGRDERHPTVQPISAGALAVLLHRATRKLEHSRARLAAERASAALQANSAQDMLRQLQDLHAEVFRVREQLHIARLEVDESDSRRLDAEAELRAEQARFVDLQMRANEVGDQLRQVLATHAQDSAAWKAQLDRAHEASSRDATAWKAELDRAHEASARDASVWQGEVERVRNAHEADNATWQAEVGRLRLLLEEAVAGCAIREQEHERVLGETRAQLAATQTPRAALGVLWRALRPARAADPGIAPGAGSRIAGASADSHTDTDTRTNTTTDTSTNSDTDAGSAADRRDD